MFGLINLILYLLFLVDASHDSQYGPNLPTKVLSPLLTKSAVDLLINCLTSKVSSDYHLFLYYTPFCALLASQLIVPHIYALLLMFVIPSFTLAKNGLFMFYTVKKASHFPVLSRDVTYQTLPITLLQCTKEVHI
jgi:hypothetical protein